MVRVVKTNMDGTKAQSTAPLLNEENRFKLAVFGLNVSGGCAMTSAEGTIQVNWPETHRLAKAADQAGLDAIVPVARWKGPGGATNFNDRSFETFTWAAAVAAVTERIQILATVHVPTAHPVRIAKEAATVDHISGGRFALNIVAGWNDPEFKMFGVTQRPHDERYSVAAEWATIIRRLWSEDTFDFDGAYFNGVGLHSSPKPIQTPGPLVMSAGASPAGQAFAAEHAEISFIQARDLESHRPMAEAVRKHARDEFGRQISVMGMGYVACADTEREAKRFVEYYVDELGDWEGVAKMLGSAGDVQLIKDGGMKQMARSMIAGYTALPLVGTPEQIVDKLLAMKDVGLDGCTLSWVNYEQGIAQYREQILPLLVQAGLRTDVNRRT